MLQQCGISTFPRVLADDMLVQSVQQAPDDDTQWLFDEHASAVERTLEYIQDLGSRVSADKCKVLSTSKALRQMLKAHTFAAMGSRIAVMCDM
eukprot:5169487-Alexandrium_andersonii.AAC.1